MSRITIESIAQELAEDGWKIRSTEYKNLDTPLEFECSEGHLVVAPYKKIRIRRECPVCNQNQFKDMDGTITHKPKGVSRTIAFDQATHICGYSIFDGKNLIKYGTYEVKATDEFDRLHEVNMWVMSMIKNWAPDVVGLEGIQYQQQVGVTTFQTLARLQGILIETCLQAKLQVKVCNTNTWRNYCGVKGRSRSDRKKSMQALVKEWYDVSVSDDCADAIGIGKYVTDNRSAQTELVEWE